MNYAFLSDLSGSLGALCVEILIGIFHPENAEKDAEFAESLFNTPIAK